MRRGDIYWVDFDPSNGSEANKVRPAVIVSNDANNRAAQRSKRGVVTVLPVTSNVDRVFVFQAFITASNSGLVNDSKAQAEQIRAVAVDRFRGRIGRLSPAIIRQLDNALRTHLVL